MRMYGKITLKPPSPGLDIGFTEITGDLNMGHVYVTAFGKTDRHGPDTRVEAKIYYKWIKTIEFLL